MRIVSVTVIVALVSVADRADSLALLVVSSLLSSFAALLSAFASVVTVVAIIVIIIVVIILSVPESIVIAVFMMGKVTFRR